MFLRYEEVKHWLPCAEALKKFEELFPDGTDHTNAMAAFKAAGRPDWADYVTQRLAELKRFEQMKIEQTAA